MYRTGHYGAALLVYAPVGYLLVLVGRDDLAVLGGAGVLALARLPDYDLRVPLVRHRGPTHTVLFGLLVGAALGAGGWLVGVRRGAAAGLELGLLGVAVGVLAVGSHLLADALTPAGVRPFWPVSSRRYSLGLARADNPLANYGLLALGVGATAAVLLVARGQM